MHGSRRELGTKLVAKNKKDLELTQGAIGRRLEIAVKDDVSTAEIRPEEVLARLARSGSPIIVAEMEAGVLAEARRRHAADWHEQGQRCARQRDGF